MRCREETRPADVHAVPDAGTGERVPLQPLPDAAEADRDCARPLSDGAPDQDLVPEPAHEMEEGKQSQIGRRMPGRTFSGTRPGHASIMR